MQGAMALVQLILTKQSSIKDLRLSGCSITRLGVAEIVKAIVDKEIEIRALYLDGCTSGRSHATPPQWLLHTLVLSLILTANPSAGDMMSIDAIDDLCKLLPRGHLTQLSVSNVSTV